MAKIAKQRVITLNREYGFTSFHRWMIVNGCSLMTENEREVFKKHFPKSNFDLIPDHRNKDLVRIKGFFDIWELNEYMDRQSCASLHVKMNRVQKEYLEAQLKCKKWDDVKAATSTSKKAYAATKKAVDDLPF
jgi:hypothetical protein